MSKNSTRTDANDRGRFSAKRKNLDFPTDGGRRVNGLSGSLVLGR